MFICIQAIKVAGIYCKADVVRFGNTIVARCITL